MNLLPICRCSLAISPPGNQSVTGNLLGMIILSIVLLTLLNTASVVPPCLILAIRVSSKFGALKERLYKKRIYLQVLKIPKQKKVEVWEFLRTEEWYAICFSCRICGI
jgi:hypothetical protein